MKLIKIQASQIVIGKIYFKDFVAVSDESRKC